MEFHILNEKGEVIASFRNEHDRGVCLDALQEYFNDCDFDVWDGDCIRAPRSWDGVVK